MRFEGVPPYVLSRISSIADEVGQRSRQRLRIGQRSIGECHYPPRSAVAQHTNSGTLLMEQSEDRTFRLHRLEDFGRRIMGFRGAKDENGGGLNEVVEHIDISDPVGDLDHP